MISGRQYLKVFGPRLIQTKDQRNNKDPVYNKDVRIGHSIEIIPCDDQALPNLGIELSGWPEGIYQGEVRKIDLNISNLSAMGQVGISRMLVRRASGGGPPTKCKTAPQIVVAFMRYTPLNALTQCCSFLQNRSLQ